MERVRAFTFSPSDTSAARSAPFSAAAPTSLLDHQRSGDAAPAGRVERIVHGDVVIGDDARRLAADHLCRHLEVHDVAVIVLDDEDHPGAGVDGLRRLQHLVWRRRGEDLARAGGVQHAMADETRVQRFVPRSAAGNQRDLALLQPLAAHELVRPVHRQDVGMRRCQVPPGFPEAACEASFISFFMGFLLRDSFQSVSSVKSVLILRANSRSPRRAAGSCASSPRSITRQAKHGAGGRPCMSPPARSGWAARYSSRNWRRSSGLKWQTAKIVARCFSGTGVE